MRTERSRFWGSNVVSCLVAAMNLVVQSGCVGPTSPFGAVDTALPAPHPFQTEIQPPPRETAESPEDKDRWPVVRPEIRFWPPRQMLHQLSPWVIEVTGIREDDPVDRLRVYYNRADVTAQVKRLARATVDGGKARWVIDRLSLPADRHHQIEVVYRHPRFGDVTAPYHGPYCEIDEEKKVLATRPFRAPASYLATIEAQAKEAAINPSFMAGLIAQESGFNPEAVSWAKAIGLTQITPLAEKDIFSVPRDWPRYPDLNEYSVPRIKTLIALGKINAEREWRLNPAYSVQGGLAYLEFLDRFWELEPHKNLLAALPGAEGVVRSQVLLASYNSGATRVREAIERRGRLWLTDPELREARRYVNRVFSYCYHFSTPEPRR